MSIFDDNLISRGLPISEAIEASAKHHVNDMVQEITKNHLHEVFFENFYYNLIRDIKFHINDVKQHIISDVYDCTDGSVYNLGYDIQNCKTEDNSLKIELIFKIFYFEQKFNFNNLPMRADQIDQMKSMICIIEMSVEF